MSFDLPLQQSCTTCILFLVIILQWIRSSLSFCGLEVSPANINIAENDILRLICTCTSISNLNDYRLSWQFNSVSAVEGGSMDISSLGWNIAGGYQAGEFYLTIPQVVVDNSGEYTCELLSNGNTLESQHVMVNVVLIAVSNFPTCLLSTIGTLTVEYELDVMCAFKQVAPGEKELELKRKLSSEFVTVAKSSTYTSNQIILNIRTHLVLASEHNGAEFMCLVSDVNMQQQTSCSFQPLQVQYRPVAVMQPILFNVIKEFEMAIFTCSVLHSYPEHVDMTWSMPGIVGLYGTERTTTRQLSNVSIELTIRGITIADNNAIVECRVENEVGVSVVSGLIRAMIDEPSVCEESPSNMWYIVVIVVVIIIVMLVLFILTSVCLKHKRDRHKPTMKRNQRIFSIDNPHRPSQMSRSSTTGSGYVTRAFRGELRETPSMETTKHKSNSKNPNHLTDSGRSSLFPDILANSSGNASTHTRTNITQSMDHTNNRPKSTHTKSYPDRSHHDDGARTNILSSRGRRHSRTNHKEMAPKHISQNSENIQQQAHYRKRKTRSERNRMRNKVTTDATSPSLQYAELAFHSPNKVTPRSRPKGREEKITIKRNNHVATYSHQPHNVVPRSREMKERTTPIVNQPHAATHSHQPYNVVPRSREMKERTTPIVNQPHAARHSHKSNIVAPHNRQMEERTSREQNKPKHSRHSHQSKNMMPSSGEMEERAPIVNQQHATRYFPQSNSGAPHNREMEERTPIERNKQTRLIHSQQSNNLAPHSREMEERPSIVNQSRDQTHAERDIVERISPIEQEPSVSRQTTVIYAEINQCTPRTQNSPGLSGDEVSVI